MRKTLFGSIKNIIDNSSILEKLKEGSNRPIIFFGSKEQYDLNIKVFSFLKIKY